MAYASKYDDQKASAPFATRLRALSEDNGASQAKIAKHVGCSYQAIGAYMRGESVPKLTDALKIAEFFGVSIDYLAGKDDCKALDNQKIYEAIGLNEVAIEHLKTVHQNNMDSTLGIIDGVIGLLNTLIADHSAAQDTLTSSLLSTIGDYIHDSTIWVKNRAMYGLVAIDPSEDDSEVDLTLIENATFQEDKELVSAMNLQRVNMTLIDFYKQHSRKLPSLNDLAISDYSESINDTSEDTNNH